MVLETALDGVRMLSGLNPALLAIVFIVFIVIAYKAFQALFKAFLVGIISASFPIVANLIGVDVPLTINSILWFGLAGVSVFMVYVTVSGGVKIARFAYKPFGVFFNRQPVQKIIIREKEKK